jgi:phenylacetate-coenzyme A ligase PaaK-like adenylate-forming protein
MDATGIVHWPPDDPGAVLERIRSERIASLVGLPVQVLGLARHPAGTTVRPGTLKSVLLSADHVPESLARGIQGIWEVPVFHHYGMTETGLGGGVECRARSGYHLREADLYYEIVDPETGKPLETGRTGEVVVTTLTRRGMPLVRYRTGDLACFTTAPCPCGTHLRRMGRVSGRIGNTVSLGNSESLSLGDMDEAAFRIPGILNFTVELSRSGDRERLSVVVHALPGQEKEVPGLLRRALAGVPAIGRTLALGLLELEVAARSLTSPPAPSGTSVKRTIRDARKEGAAGN